MLSRKAQQSPKESDNTAHEDDGPAVASDAPNSKNTSSRSTEAPATESDTNTSTAQPMHPLHLTANRDDSFGEV